MIPNQLTTEEKKQRVFVGKIRLVKHPKSENYLVGTDRVRIQLPPPRLQQFDGKEWVDVEIVEEGK